MKLLAKKVDCAYCNYITEGKEYPVITRSARAYRIIDDDGDVLTIAHYETGENPVVKCIHTNGIWLKVEDK